MLTYSYTGDLDTKGIQTTVEAMNLGTVGVTTGSAFGTDLETVQICSASGEIRHYWKKLGLPWWLSGKEPA